MKTKLQACIIGEQDGGEYIARLLRNEYPEFEIVFQNGKLDRASDYPLKHFPDLFFLETRLMSDPSEIFRNLREHLSRLIFITDSEKSAIKAIKTGVCSCLMKPVKDLEFVISVNKAIENIRTNRTLTRTSSRNKINLPTLQGFKRVAVDEIIRCEADSNYTFIYLSDKSRIVVCRTLYDFEKSFSEHRFFRIHHKHLINLDHLKEYIKGKGGQVVMTDNSVLDVSVRKKYDFLHTFL
ncbi:MULTISPECIES: LytR/AlgR family response regulator transcription factor [Chryseobacterium]|uniref:Two-component system LytT family response regulator n=1 Tax=Chryseobacterium camelliae TaxID=1265445 RepID=A0ABU0THE2_9FLAO|nr:MULTISPECIES: LytTR family DNA-binding domain-containing protein [Chryseobacterium]MDT3405723.1 two-component system LytT family response regulator [Pseudacidovorax intermedius]MDQ1096467.1 two-component system LytT family response regulator [Chryseobacterium camelliae]MDQ1100407.1 two-component system LytT family response regulator [Chryseobacterium sp. SORGH_AS_1048]MDR6087748.1 two-component system LytT family response regulator [Chryseobacterium sp. SORGH_AS_0909]MDR6132124.1 two-compon